MPLAWGGYNDDEQNPFDVAVEGPVREKRWILFAGCFILAMSWLAVYTYVDSRSGPIINKPCVKSGDGYILYFKRARSNKKSLMVLNLRPGRISVETKPEVKAVEFVTKEKAVVEAERITGVLFRKDLRRNLVITALRLFPEAAWVKRIDVSISRKPVLSVPVLLFQFAFLFIVLGLSSLTLLSLWETIFKRKPPQEVPVRTLVFLFVALIMIVFSYFVLNIREFLKPFDPVDLRLVGKIAGFNAGLACVLLILFYAFSRRPGREKLPVLLPALVSLPIAFLKIPFNAGMSADSILWILNLTRHKANISFAESLSLILNKFLHHLLNSVAPVSAMTTLTVTGKIIGVLFIFLLFGFVNSFRSFSLQKKLLLFVLSLTFSSTVLLFGFPEFRYYSLPFLMASFLSARRYISSEDDGRKDLIAAALWALVAGLFHGTAYFSFPVILLLPLLKYRDADRANGKPPFLWHYSAILLAAGAVFAVFFALIRIFNLDLRFETAGGGFDGRQFISFLPVNIHFPQAVNFLEVGYLFSRGWIFFITGSFVFLVFALRLRRSVALERSDLVLLLFGLSQFLIVLFWGFDSGIREIDLYVAPMTMLYLFMTRYVVGTIQSEHVAWRYILAFSLLSPIYLLILKTV